MHTPTSLHQPADSPLPSWEPSAVRQALSETVALSVDSGHEMRCSSLVPLFSPILLLFPHFSAFWQHVAVINGAVQFIPAES